jgi:uncharacterized protein with HEPN domain
MDKDNQVYLSQIVEASKKIAKYIEGVGFEEFKKDELLQDAVIRNLEVIGEAANRLNNEFLENHQDIPLVLAVAMRNKLVHDYDQIDLKIVWGTVTKNLPNLVKRIRTSSHETS